MEYGVLGICQLLQSDHFSVSFFLFLSLVFIFRWVPSLSTQMLFLETLRRVPLYVFFSFFLLYPINLQIYACSKIATDDLESIYIFPFSHHGFSAGSSCLISRLNLYEIGIFVRQKILIYSQFNQNTFLFALIHVSH